MSVPHAIGHDEWRAARAVLHLRRAITLDRLARLAEDRGYYRVASNASREAAAENRLANHFSK